MSVKTTEFSELEFAALAPIKFCDDCSFFHFSVAKKDSRKTKVDYDFSKTLMELWR